MKFSYNLIKKYVDINLEPQKLADVITLKAAEVESFSDVGNDTIFEIKILPGRSDLLSHYGLAREIAALTGTKFKGVTIEFKEAEEEASSMLSVEVKDGEACPRYAARVIRDVSVRESPEWLRETLEKLGQRSINSIVDITNYVMFELGQPLHAFDHKQLEGQKIVVRKAKKKEAIKILDENQTEYPLSDEVLVIADKEKPLAIAGIKGGVNSGISDATSTIVLEAATFNASLIRRTSLDLRLRTDASMRFSYGLDPNLAEVALDRAAQLIHEVAKGQVLKGRIDIYPKPVSDWKITLHPERVSSLIGIEIAHKDIEAILKSLGVELTQEGLPADRQGEQWLATVPTYRLDLKTEEDLIEEVARIYGYDAIPAIAPSVEIVPALSPESGEAWEVHEHLQARDLMRDILKGFGFTETYNYSFISDETKEIFALTTGPELLNPLSEQYRYMRPGLMPNLARAIEHNTRFYDTLRMFEVGNVFTQKGDEVAEQEELAGMVASNQAFEELKGSVETFLHQLGISDLEFVADGKQAAWCHPGKSATIKTGSTVLGSLGELHPLIAKRLALKGNLRVSGFVFSMPILVRAMQQELEFEPIPKYPSVIRDLSILVSKNVTIGQVLATLQNADSGDLVRDVDIFDMYEGDKLEADKKSLAFHVVYRSDDHTLTDEEVDTIEQKIKKALADKLGAEIR